MSVSTIPQPRQRVDAKRAAGARFGAARVETPAEPLVALGLMSGTSLDGIDAALITTDGAELVKFHAAVTVPYPPAFRSRLRALLGRRPEAGDAEVIAELTDRHGEAVAALLERAGRQAREIDVIGFHGQTVLHRPEAGETVQIGDGDRLARQTGIPVVDSFRMADVAAGGQGAPFAPLYHAALAHDLEHAVAVVNIGGVANVTWIGSAVSETGVDERAVLAFDTGPGNALIDDWLAATAGVAMDEDGRFAAEGRIDPARLDALLAHPFFVLPPPKSLDRDEFADAISVLRGLSPADGAATLAAFTARSIAAAMAFFPGRPARWLVCGGGRHNPVLLAKLAETVAAPVAPVEAVGWRGDSLEAEAFAYLAVRSLRGLPLSLPSTTGVAAPTAGGVLRRPGPAAPRSR